MYELNKKFMILFFLFLIVFISCSHERSRSGKVIDKLNLNTALIRLKNKEVKIGDKVKFIQIICSYGKPFVNETMRNITRPIGFGRGYEDYDLDQCEHISLGEGQVIKIIAPTLFVVTLSKNIKIDKKTYVDINQ